MHLFYSNVMWHSEFSEKYAVRYSPNTRSTYILNFCNYQVKVFRYRHCLPQEIVKNNNSIHLKINNAFILFSFQTNMVCLDKFQTI